MPVAFLNYEYKYQKNGKPVFAPNDRGARIGNDLKRKINRAFQFDPFYYHFRKGGHVAALHAHRGHRFFARLDLERYFYSISKSRVQRVLSESGILRARHYAKWSCVRNPFDEPRYSLPYGFVQSPIIATLVMMRSGVGDFLRTVGPDVTASVYMDDISLSSNDEELLRQTFATLRVRLEEANFIINMSKVREPGPAIDLFNCDLRSGHTSVKKSRVDQFYGEHRTQSSEEAFERYCDGVEAGNT